MSSERYQAQRLDGLLRGGLAELHSLIMATPASSSDGVVPDVSDLVLEKVDVERALGAVGLTDKQRAMGALVAMGWNYRAAARVLHVSHTAVRRLINGEHERPGLAARCAAFLNGDEEAP